MTSTLNQMLLTMLVVITICYTLLYAWVWLIQHNFQPIHGAAAKGHLNILQLLVDVYDVDPTATTEVY